MGFEPTTIAWEARLPLHPCDVGRQAAQKQLIVSTFLGDGKIQDGIIPDMFREAGWPFESSWTWLLPQHTSDDTNMV